MAGKDVSREHAPSRCTQRDVFCVERMDGRVDPGDRRVDQIMVGKGIGRPSHRVLNSSPKAGPDLQKPSSATRAAVRAHLDLSSLWMPTQRRLYPTNLPSDATLIWRFDNIWKCSIVLSVTSRPARKPSTRSAKPGTSASFLETQVSRETPGSGDAIARWPGSRCSAIGALGGHRLHLTAFPTLRRGIAELGTRASSAEQDQWRFRFARDSALEGDGFEPLVPLLGRAQLSRHARGGPLPSADSLRIQLSSSMRSAATKPSGWSSMTWCLASGTSTTGARGPIRDDI